MLFGGALRLTGRGRSITGISLESMTFMRG